MSVCANERVREEREEGERGEIVFPPEEDRRMTQIGAIKRFIMQQL